MNTLARHHEPIIAVATAAGRGAVGIVRLSGRHLLPLAKALTGADLSPRQAHLLAMKDEDGRTIDTGLALHFPAPHSYTGEDVLELQVHGGPVVMQMLLARCLALGAARHLRVAEPGEFTLRAFLNGKIDLAQAEAVADLIDANTEAAARSATRSLDGVFSREIDALAAQLIELRTLIEATLDFPEEEVDVLKKHEVAQRITDALDGVTHTLGRAHQGRLLRDGVTVVLAGQPNVGKSSLLNQLAGADVAIVTATAGTTRDRVTQAIQIEGIALNVIDTAGLRDESLATDEAERIGMRRSWDAISQADAVLFMHDLTRRADADHQAADALIERQLRDKIKHFEQRVIHVDNKVDDLRPTNEGDAPGDEDPSGDLQPGFPVLSVQEGQSLRVPVRDLFAKPASRGLRLPTLGLPRSQPHADHLVISALTGQGLHTLRQALLRRVGWQAVPEGAYIARARHVQALANARDHLQSAQGHTQQAVPALELLAEDLRLAHQALATITGDFTADDLLGQIFGRFCIGK